MAKTQKHIEAPEAFQDPDYWTLARLRDSGYAQRIPPRDRWTRVGPTRQRKLYPNGASHEYLHFRPNRFRAFYFDLPSEMLKSRHEVQPKIDKRPLEDLDNQAGDCLRQMIVRARVGDALAMRFVVHRAYNLLRQIELLEKDQPQLTAAMSVDFDRWPVLLGRIGPFPKSDDPKRESRRYPKQLETVLARLHNLQVGTKALIPAGPGRTTDKQSFWAQLAQWAVGECFNTGTLVKLFERKAADFDAKPQKHTLTVWNTAIEEIYYYVSDGPIYAVLAIRDWEKKCSELKSPITPENFVAWRAVVREFVREYFYNCKPAYREALRKILPAQTDIDEAVRRNKALDYVSQALKTLVLG